MELRKNLLSALLLAVGYILHQIVPGMVLGMKPDFMLSLMFVVLILNFNFKNALVTGVMAGIMTSLTTTFPGGQIPNFIDKVITAIVIFGILKTLQEKKNSNIGIAIVSFLGTIVSGTIFLYSAMILVGLPAPFKVLFISVVVPASIINVFVTFFFVKIVSTTLKASNLNKYFDLKGN